MENKKSILDAAICQFKLNVGKITKDKNNPFFKSKYADLAIILDVIDDDLAKAGLTLKSKSLMQDGSWVLRTDLKHKDSDEVEFSTFPIFGSKPQEIGSSITYARRYNIQSLLNLAAEDDDGNEANKSKPIASAFEKKEPIEEKATASSKVDQYKKFLENIKTVKTTQQIEWLKANYPKWLEWTKANYSIEYCNQLQDAYDAKLESMLLPDDDLPDFIKPKN